MPRQPKLAVGTPTAGPGQHLLALDQVPHFQLGEGLVGLPEALDTQPPSVLRFAMEPGEPSGNLDQAFAGCESALDVR